MQILHQIGQGFSRYSQQLILQVKQRSQPIKHMKNDPHCQNKSKVVQRVQIKIIKDRIHKIKMNKKQIILAVLYCFILISSIKADTAPQQDSTALSIDIELANSIKKVQYKQRVFVDVDATHYYEATIFNKNDKIQIQILNENVKTFELVFKRLNPVIFIDAYQNYIIVKEVTPLGAILSYFVLTIIYDVEECKFYLDYFAVNPRVDYEFFHFTSDFQITQILQLDVDRQWLAVLMPSKSAYDVYKINIAEKLNTLVDARFFLVKKWEVITGGNSRVLFDQANNQFLVDTMNCRPQNSPAVYSYIPVCNLTSYPLYPECSRTYNIIGYNFQYVSEATNHKSMTTFLWRGYGDQTILGNAYLKSKKPIRIIADDYNFFIAITDCDIYLTNVYYDTDYHYFADTLSNTVSSKVKRAQIYEDWSQIEVIVFIENKFYFIACDKFYVYGTNPCYFTKLYEANCVNDNSDLYTRLFIEIKKYLVKTQ